MKNITELNAGAVAKLLIDNHTIGGLRDEGDLRNSQYHAGKSLAFVRDIIFGFKGTKKQKLEFIEKIFIDLEKFKVKKLKDEKLT
jgi:hypothetical protein